MEDRFVPGPVFVHGERLNLRTVEHPDHEFLHRYWNRPSIRRGTNRHRPMSESDITEAVDGEDIHLLPCDDREPVGLVWFFDIDQVASRAEIGYWIIPEAQGEGYATEAVDLGVTYTLEELGLNKLMARVFEDNQASIQVLEKLEFEHEGTLRDHYWVNGRYVNTHLYARFAST